MSCPRLLSLIRFASPLVAAILAIMVLGSATAQTPQHERLAAAKMEVDRIQAELERSNISDEFLQKLRASLDPVRTELLALQGGTTGPRDAAKARLDNLGPSPKPGDPPESEELAEARKRELAAFIELDSLAKDAQLQAVRADQLADRIIVLRRDMFTRQLTERVASIADPLFWVNFVSDVPRELWSLWTNAHNAIVYARSRMGIGALGSAGAIVLGGLGMAIFLRRRVVRLREHLAAKKTASQRLAGSMDALLVLLHALLGWPLFVLIPILALTMADLFPKRTIDDFGTPLVIAVLFGIGFAGLARAILSIDRPQLRLLPLSDWAVKRIYRRAGWAALVMGIGYYLQALGRGIYAPVTFTVGISALSAGAFAAIAISLLLRLQEAPAAPATEGPGEEVNRLDILRPILWMAALGIIICLLVGYIALADFLARVTLLSLFTVALTHVLVVLIGAGLSDGRAADEERGRAIASTIGVSPTNVAFTATLLSGVLRFLVIAAACLVPVSQLGFYSTDMLSATQRAFFGFKVGEITISPSSILLGVALAIIVLLVFRLIRSWVRYTLLPRTRLDAGLQNSIATVVGYVGGVLAIAVGLSEVGLSLQNFAIVAGALSVGIGFGLQSIVSNFVSGLILLAERPIRVGDIINVGGEEGFVRRISVRATEIETYERATLIVPNQQLITGVVKNWVFGNTWSRIKVSVAVGYDVDIDMLRQAMLKAAEDDPRILPAPPPRVFLSELANNALHFEMVAVIASVESGPAVKSDLHIKIVKAFREKGIRVVAQLPATPAPVVVKFEDALEALEKARASLGPPNS